MTDNGNRDGQMRRAAGKAVLVLAYAMLAVQLLSDLLVLGGGLLGSGLTLLLAVAATSSARRGSGLSDELIALSLIGQVIVLTASYRGHTWQIDTHMVYFVMLAGISTLANVRALLLAAAITAVHHLGLTLALPALVYPSTDLVDNLLRTAFHGGVVVVETAVLSLSILRGNRMMARIVDQKEGLADQSHRAEIAEVKARKMMSEGQQAIALLREHLHRLADRDVTCRIADEMPETFEDLRKDFNLAVDRLSHALGEAQDKAQSFDGETRLLAQLIDSIANGSRAQAEDLGQQSEQLDLLSARLKDAATQAESAAQQVTTARKEADQGGAITREAVAAMERIEKSSDEVGNIMDLIDDIAFQTNLLALNAGVEAARAGSSGRGFAVVAAEVQALSQRTADAARGVKELISSSEEEVATGARLVNEAGHRLSLIVDHVNAVSDVISTIRTESGERAREMVTVSQKMAELDAEAQTVLGQSAEMTGSGLRLRDHAERLAEVMEAFSVGQDRAPEPARREAT